MLAASLLLLALAASSSDLVVSVTDPSGGRVPGATVVIDPDSPKNVVRLTGQIGRAHV